MPSFFPLVSVRPSGHIKKTKFVFEGRNSSFSRQYNQGYKAHVCVVSVSKARQRRGETRFPGYLLFPARQMIKFRIAAVAWAETNRLSLGHST